MGSIIKASFTLFTSIPGNVIVISCPFVRVSVSSDDHVFSLDEEQIPPQNSRQVEVNEWNILTTESYVSSRSSNLP
jgi:hypothetical protein